MFTLKNKKEVFLYLFLIVLCLILIRFADFMHSPPRSAKILSGVWELSFEGRNTGSQSPPVYFSGNDDDFKTGVYSFIYNLKLESEYYNYLEYPVLVLPANSGNGMRVKMNDTVLGIKGDLQEGRASLWNVQHVFHIPQELFTENNIIQIELYGLYEAGLIVPPYLIDAGGSFMPKLFLILWSTVFTHLLIGGLLILGLIFLITGLAPVQKDLQKIFIGLGLFFISVFLLDYSFLNDVVIPYIVFKKIIIASQFLATAFFIMFITDSAGLLGNRFAYLIVIAHFVLVVMTLIYPGNMVALRKFYQLAYFINLFLFVYLIYLFLSKVEHSFDMTAIYSGGFIALVFSIHDVFCLFDTEGQIFMSQYGLIFLFLSGASVIVYQIFGNYLESIRQRKRAEQFYQDAMKDALTGVYNRKIMPVIESGLNEPYSVLLFDLDDFKEINDCYGHIAGDIALQNFVKSIGSYVRNNDFIIRTGGDEFIAVLPGCSSEVAETQGRRILSHAEGNIINFGKYSFSVKATFGTATAEAGTPLSEPIAAADKRMYINKKKD